MYIESLKSIFERDLFHLRLEIESYQDEKDIWKVDKQITNCGGNLCLHLIGNLQSFIGGHLGNTGYVRNRELEFSTKNIPRSQLITAINKTNIMLNKVLSNLSQEQLEADYPVEVFGEKMSTHYFLTHLTTHLAYHLGQINYHRRLLSE